MASWLRVRRDTPAITILGDSLAAGEHASHQQLAWASRALRALAQETGGAGRNSRVIAIPGARVADLVARRLPVASAVAVVEVGTNDWIGFTHAEQQRRVTPLREFAESYVALLDSVDDGCTSAVICMGIWGPRRARHGGGPPLEEYDAVIRTLSEGRGGRFVPLSWVYELPESRGPEGRPSAFGRSDGMHPNDLGHARIAEAAVDAVREALGTTRCPSPEVVVSAAAL